MSKPGLLVVVAHPDDETFGCIGTLLQLKSEYQIWIMSICNGVREEDATGWVIGPERCQTLNQNADDVGAEVIVLDHPDLTLDIRDHYRSAAREVERAISSLQPDVVITHSQYDLHLDHIAVHKMVSVATRPVPSCSVQRLYTFDGIGTHPPVEPNVFVDITDVIDQKCKMAERYATEMCEYPDIRSVEGLRTIAQYHGNRVGVEFAEAFRLVYAKNQKTL